MSAAPVPVPNWGAWCVRALIYTGVAALAYWWSPYLAIGVAAFMAVDLLHHAADTARRRAGYMPIPRHPSNPDTPQRKLQIKGRPILLCFALFWVFSAIVGRFLVGADWPEAILQGLAFAIGAAIFAVAFFPVMAMVLLWVMSIFIGMFLSLSDLVAIFIASPERRKSWHRNVDQYDHRLADVILGQSAAVPLRADLAERAAEDARNRK